MLSQDYSFAWTPWPSPVSPKPWDYFLCMFTLHQSQKSDVFQGSFTGIKYSWKTHSSIYSEMGSCKRPAPTSPIPFYPCTNMLSTRAMWPLLQAPSTQALPKLPPSCAWLEHQKASLTPSPPPGGSPQYYISSDGANMPCYPK